MTVETRGVLAGAYLRGDDRRVFLTHAVEVEPVTSEFGDYTSPVRVLCGRVKPDNICDASADPAGITKAPTCPTCARRDPRGNSTPTATNEG